MNARISIIGPVLNEVDFIGYCIMQTLPFVHEYIYALDQASNDGTRELLQHIKSKHAHEKLVVIETPNFHPSDMPKYNASFNSCIEKMTGDAAWFLHPDMLVENPEKILSMPQNALAWYVHMTSYAKDMQTVYKKGRTDKWKNIHRNKFGLHYYGAYGGNVEDFFHSDITGSSYKQHRSNFDEYPFQVCDSGLRVKHFCELKPYKRRLEKMIVSLKAQNPNFSDQRIEELAMNHPRVTLENSSQMFGDFETQEVQEDPMPVFAKYRDEFAAFKKAPTAV